MEKLLKSEADTNQLATEFAMQVKNGAVVFLYGELGAGKTTFVKAVAAALGIKDRITSPTYTIVRQHLLPSGKTFYHIDLYRVAEISDLRELGLEEILEDKNNIVMIEWPEKLDPKLADYQIRFTKLSETDRKINIIEAFGQRQ